MPQALGQGLFLLSSKIPAERPRFRLKREEDLERSWRVRPACSQHRGGDADYNPYGVQPAIRQNIPNRIVMYIIQIIIIFASFQKPDRFFETCQER